jgi:hypothetical protein
MCDLDVPELGPRDKAKSVTGAEEGRRAGKIASRSASMEVKGEPGEVEDAQDEQTKSLDAAATG